MILAKRGKETWLGCAVRRGNLDGMGSRVAWIYSERVAEGFDERRAAYLACAELGLVDGVE